jgi:hypothetical protein
MGGRPPSPIGVIDLSTDKLALGIQQDMTPVRPQIVFDEAGRLNFRVGSPLAGQPKIGTRVDGFAFMVCNLAGECWFSSDQYAEPIEFVLPNRR